MKAKPYRRKYDVLHITQDTTREELGNFVENPDSVGIKINGVGFCASTSLTLNCGNKLITVHPGAVFLKNSEGGITLIDGQAYNFLFYEEDK